MDLVLRQVRDWQTKYDCPVLLAGDVFDRWSTTPRLLNFALEHLPDRLFAVAGQHDLPEHSLGQLHRSGLRTLELAGKLIIVGAEGLKIPRARVYGSSWGEIIPQPRGSTTLLNILLLHRFVWWGKRPPSFGFDSRISSLYNECEAYNLVLVGDNHEPFDVRQGNTLFWNNGSMMRRSINQREHKPRCGLWRESGVVEPLYFDVSADKWRQQVDPEKEQEPLALEEFLVSLGGLLSSSGDVFGQMLEQYLIKASPRVRQVIEEAMRRTAHDKA